MVNTTGRSFCVRCGRDGHWDDSCAQDTFFDGAPIPRPPAVSPPRSPRRAGVYVLRDQSNRYYVGKSGDVQGRVKYHLLTSPWLQGGITEVTPQTEPLPSDLESWERNETLHLMRQHGIGNVRGWMFTAVGALTSAQEALARQQINEKYDLCRRCGAKGHFYKACPAR